MSMLRTTDTLLGPQPTDSAYAEGYRILRANLTALHNADPFKSVLITSALPREGKTTASINLSTILALAGKRTIMVDVDAYHEGLGRSLEIRGRAGLTDLCMGDASVDDVLVQTEIETLWAVPVGTKTELTSELSIDPSMGEAIKSLAARADFVILDALPSLGFSTAISLAPVVDLVLVVARARGKSEPVQQTIASLIDVGGKVAGVVVTDILPQHSTVSGSYYYNYYYR